MSQIFLLALLVLWSVPCGAQAPKLEDLRVSFASFGVIYYPHFIAKELGFYRDEGFNVELDRDAGWSGDESTRLRRYPF